MAILYGCQLTWMRLDYGRNQATRGNPIRYTREYKLHAEVSLVQLKLSLSTLPSLCLQESSANANDTNIFCADDANNKQGLFYMYSGVARSYRTFETGWGNTHWNWQMSTKDHVAFLLHLAPLYEKLYKRSILICLLCCKYVCVAKACIPPYWKLTTPPSISVWLSKVNEIKSMVDVIATSNIERNNFIKPGSVGLTLLALQNIKPWWPVQSIMVPISFPSPNTPPFLPYPPWIKVKV